MESMILMEAAKLHYKELHCRERKSVVSCCAMMTSWTLNNGAKAYPFQFPLEWIEPKPFICHVGLCMYAYASR